MHIPFDEFKWNSTDLVETLDFANAKEREKDFKLVGEEGFAKLCAPGKKLAMLPLMRHSLS